MGRLWDYTNALFGGSGSAFNSESLYILLNYALILAIGIIGATPLCKKLFAKLEGRLPGIAYTLSVVLVVAGFLLTVTYLVAAENNPFLYFDF